MRKVEAMMVMAVRSAINGDNNGWRSGNTRVSVEHQGIHGTPIWQRDVVVHLHGNEIARFDSSLSGARECRGLRITDAGYETNTTKNRLNALLQCFAEGSCLYQKQGQWYAPDGTEWWGTFWLPYGWRGGCFCDQAEALSKAPLKRSASIYDAQWHQAMGDALAAAKEASGAPALA